MAMIQVNTLSLGTHS